MVTEVWISAIWRRYEGGGEYGGFFAPCLMVLRSNAPESVFWGPGLAYMTMVPKQEFTIVEVFGAAQKPERGDPDEVYDTYYALVDHARIAFDKATPPEEQPLSAEEGWLSPEAKFYPCGYGGHSGMATKIEHVFLSDDADRATSDDVSDEFLRQKGWIAIRDGGLTVRWDGDIPYVTPDQYAALARLHAAMLDYEEEDGLRYSIGRVLKAYVGPKPEGIG